MDSACRRSNSPNNRSGSSQRRSIRRGERTAAKTVTRLAEMAEILNRVAGWAGGRAQAVAWYRSEPIPAFGDRTAELLVKSGQATALRDYLDSIAMGGFA